MQQQQHPPPPPYLQQRSQPSRSQSMMSTPTNTRTQPLSSCKFVRELDHLHDVLTVMRRQERVYYNAVSPSFSATCHSPPSGLVIVAPRRSSLVQWMSSVVDIFQLAPQIVATGMYFLDRSSMLLSSTDNPRQYALLGMTCLELAIKMHDTKIFPLMEMTKMGLVPDCSVEEIVHMEGILMQALQWKLNPPTPHCFIHQYGLLLEAVLVQHYRSIPRHYHPQTPSLAERVQKVVEEAIGLVRLCLYYYNNDDDNDNGAATIPPAVAGYASMLAAMEQRSFHFVPTNCKQDFCRYMLTMTGLSASSPGLVQAYQLVSMMNNKSNGGTGGYAVPTTFGITPTRHYDSNTTTMRIPVPMVEPSVVPVAYVTSPTHIASMSMSTTSPPPPAALPVLQQQPPRPPLRLPLSIAERRKKSTEEPKS